MPPSREDQTECAMNTWFADHGGICPTCKRDLNILKAEFTHYHYMAMCNTPEVYVEKYNRKTPLVMRLAAIPFTIGGNVLNWWQSR